MVSFPCSLRLARSRLISFSIQILINAMTPPPYIPMANGLAQSVVSLARFIGPLTGGVGKFGPMHLHHLALADPSVLCSVVKEHCQWARGAS